jgi:hypothetical protein
VVFGVFLVFTAVQIINSVDDYRLTAGSRLRTQVAASVPNLVVSCFLVFWSDYFGDANFLVVFGFMAAYRHPEVRRPQRLRHGHQ